MERSWRWSKLSSVLHMCVMNLTKICCLLSVNSDFFLIAAMMICVGKNIILRRVTDFVMHKRKKLEDAVTTRSRVRSVEK